MSLTKDILLKAASDVESGMWCRGHWVTDDRNSPLNAGPAEVFTHPIEDLEGTYRCAEGSILVAARLLGGDYADGEAAIHKVGESLECCEGFLFAHNDDHLPRDPFEAGQILGELFRKVADSL